MKLQGLITEWFLGRTKGLFPPPLPPALVLSFELISSPGEAENPGDDPRHDTGLPVHGRPNAALAQGASHLLGIRAKRNSLLVLNDHRGLLLLRVSLRLLLLLGHMEASCPNSGLRFVVTRRQIGVRGRRSKASAFIRHRAEENNTPNRI